MRWTLTGTSVLTAALSGCASFGRRPRTGYSPSDVPGLTDALARNGDEFTILNVVASLAVLMAFGAVIGRAFGLPVPTKVAGAAVACAIGAWLLRTMLVQYMGVAAFVAIAGVVIAGVALALGWRKRLEKRFGFDLDWAVKRDKRERCRKKRGSGKSVVRAEGAD